MPNLDADRFLEDLTGKHARAYAEQIDALLVALATDNRVARRVARDRLAEVIAETMGTAEVLGASLALQETAKVIGQDAPAVFSGIRLLTLIKGLGVTEMILFAHAPTQTILPRVTLAEAVEDMVARTPVTIRRAAERTAMRISQLYSADRVTAFVNSAEAAVTERVQGLIREAIRTGTPEVRSGRQIVASVDDIRKRTAAWTEDYARMAFRTNVNTAVTAGRFRQVQDPDIRAVIPAFRFDSVGDADTRHNHDAADGLIFKVDNQVWNRIAPPLGWNCRCQASLVSLPMLRRMGRVDERGNIREDRLPSTAFPDPGFRHGGRADLFVNQVTR